MSDDRTFSIYVNLDADVLIHFSSIYAIKSNMQDFEDFENITDGVFRRNQEFLLFIYDKITNDPDGPIKFLVTETVFAQVHNSPQCREFIKNYCYVPKINVTNCVNKTKLASRLACCYCFGYKNPLNGEFIEPPMDIEEDKETHNLMRSADATIMGETTREYAILLTLNGQHFVFNKKTGGFNRDRRLGIKAINEAYGFASKRNGKQTFISQPFTVQEFAEILKRDAYSFIIADDSNNKCYNNNKTPNKTLFGVFILFIANKIFHDILKTINRIKCLIKVKITFSFRWIYWFWPLF